MSKKVVWENTGGVEKNIYCREVIITKITHDLAKANVAFSIICILLLGFINTWLQYLVLKITPTLRDIKGATRMS